MMKIYLNGKIVEEGEAKISVFDRSCLFGEGLFETLRSYDETLPFLDRHLKRMEWSATFLGLPFPHPREITEGIRELLQSNHLKNARVKILLSGINQGIRPQLPQNSTSMNLVILCEPFSPLPAGHYSRGVALTFVHSVKNDPPPTSNIKAMNSLSKMIARREFLEKDSFDGILTNAGGYVTETTSSNIFWVVEDKVCTAPVSAGLLPGVTRDILSEILKKEGIAFRESLVKEEDFLKLSEVFLTGSTLEVMPVTEVNKQKIGSGKLGETTLKIIQLYQKHLKEEIRTTSL